MLKGLIPSVVRTYRTETKICLQPDHRHKDNHVDILAFTLNGHEIVVESERWSLKYCVHCDDKLVRQEVNAAELNAYIEGLQA